MEPQVRKILEMNAFDSSADASKKSSLLLRRLDNLGAASVLFYSQPIEMVRAEGVWMISSDGQRYLDFYNNVPSVGHCHPRVIEAISKQVSQLNIHTRYLNKVVDNYLELLKSTFPANLDNILLACTGSEANDLALRIAAKRSGAKGFIVTETAYHGNTLATTEVSPAALKTTPLPDYVITVPAPQVTNYPEGVEKGFADAIESAIATLKERGFGFAGFICDSIFSSDGVLGNPAGFLKETVNIVKANGGLYIADEVQPGFARTGSHMWGFQRHDVTPDLVTMGKPMGNGFPISGVAVQSGDLKLFCEDVGYFNTFGGNPVAAAAGHAVLNIIEQEGLMANTLSVGNYLEEELTELQVKYPVMAEIRVFGLFIGIDICTDGDPAKPSPKLASRIINTLKQHKVLIGAAGKYGNTLKARPPLCLRQEEVDIFIAALKKTLPSIF